MLLLLEKQIKKVLFTAAVSAASLGSALLLFDGGDSLRPNVCHHAQL